MVLVNGADGIGTGWMTKVPNYNPREIIRNLKKMLKGEEAKPMTPWFKNFRGTIEPLDHQRYVVNGEVASLSDTKIEITELPVKTWTNAYKEMLEGMLAVSIANLSIDFYANVDNRAMRNSLHKSQTIRTTTQTPQ